MVSTRCHTGWVGKCTRQVSPLTTSPRWVRCPLCRPARPLVKPGRITMDCLHIQECQATWARGDARLICLEICPSHNPQWFLPRSPSWWGWGDLLVWWTACWLTIWMNSTMSTPHRRTISSKSTDRLRRTRTEREGSDELKVLSGGPYKVTSGTVCAQVEWPHRG